MNLEEQKKIEKILKNNIKEVPYEGTEVNTYNLKEAIYEYGKEMYNQAIDDAIYEISKLQPYSNAYGIEQAILKLKKQ